MNYGEKILIGGKALNVLGSSRFTNDTDYLIFDGNNYKPFLKDVDNNTDYINGNGHNFFEAIWKMEKGNQIASPQALLELKAYSYVQHLLNGSFQKSDDAAYDMRFLTRKFGVKNLDTVKKYLSAAEFSEVFQIINTVK